MFRNIRRSARVEGVVYALGYLPGGVGLWDGDGKARYGNALPTVDFRGSKVLFSTRYAR